ncbi:MAG TPA: hypothetical protein PLI57_06360 [Spirochaetota bacterium]|nr:hypothetical protein [Spirochaetota bacterium]
MNAASIFDKYFVTKKVFKKIAAPRQFFGEGEKFDAYDVKNKNDTYGTNIFYFPKN